MSAFLFGCFLCNHSFPTNPNSVTNCFQLFSLCYNFTTTFAQCVAILIFDFETGFEKVNTKNATLERAIIVHEFMENMQREIQPEVSNALLRNLGIRLKDVRRIEATFAKKKLTMASESKIYYQNKKEKKLNQIHQGK